jgi:hypothetical protein
LALIAVLTTEFWLSVFIPATISIALILYGGAMRRYVLLVLGIVGLLLAVGWLIVAVYAEAVVE